MASGLAGEDRLASAEWPATLSLGGKRLFLEIRGDCVAGK
jgi:hypothetical protein